jgi:patatin-like phospholipase/acyl hydrolase
MKILSLHGGGTVGYRTARLLQYLEEETKHPCWHLFDLIAGVSAGAIVGGMLAHKIHAENICEHFKNIGNEVFVNKRSWIGQLFYPAYKTDKLKEIGKEVLDIPLRNCATKFMCYAIRLDNYYIRPKHWKSWDISDALIPTYHPILASSAAPVLFEPYEFEENVNGVVHRGTYIDGGVISNNPSMSALSEAIRLGESISNSSLYMLNVGFGRVGEFSKKDFTGLIKTALNITPVFMASADKTDEYQAEQLLGNRYHLINPPRIIGMESLDFDMMDEQAAQMWEANKKKILNGLGV